MRSLHMSAARCGAARIPSPRVGSVVPAASTVVPRAPLHILPWKQCQLSQRSLCIVQSTPDTEEARSPADAPQEWEVPAPSKRPDIFPEFEKMDRVFLPKPLPGDPEMPDEESEEGSKRTTPGDPDPEQKPGEPPEPEEAPVEPGKEPERPGTDIPTNPE